MGTVLCYLGLEVGSFDLVVFSCYALDLFDGNTVAKERAADGAVVDGDEAVVVKQVVEFVQEPVRAVTNKTE